MLTILQNDPFGFPKTVLNDGRLFVCVGFAPYRTKDGRDIHLAEWRGHCVQCGSAFKVRTPRLLDNTKSFEAKHCQSHKIMAAYARLKSKKT